jgi:type III secretory pathway component EscU
VPLHWLQSFPQLLGRRVTAMPDPAAFALIAVVLAVVARLLWRLCVDLLLVVVLAVVFAGVLSLTWAVAQAVHGT